MCRYWHEQWHGYLCRAIYRYHSSNPYERISMVGESKVDMATQISYSIKFHIKPSCLTCLNLCACFPIEGYQIFAQARIGSSIGYIQTKVNRLVGLDFQIYIFCIYLVISTLEASEFLNQVTQDVWSQSTQFESSRDRQSNLGTCCILAIWHHTNSYIGTLVTLVSQIEA